MSFDVKCFKRLSVFVFLVVFAQTAALLNPATDFANAGETGLHIESFVQLSRGKVHYEVTLGSAQGPWVVLVPGFALPMESWDPVVSSLSAAGYRVLRFDRYGQGLSASPYLNYTPALFVGLVDELVTTLKLDGPFHLVGFSFGGSIVVKYANEHPEKIRTVTAVDPVGFPPILPLSAKAAEVPGLGEVMAKAFSCGMVEKDARRAFINPAPFEALFAEIHQQCALPGAWWAALSTVRDTLSRDFSDEYLLMGRSPEAAPFALIFGAKDQVIPGDIDKNVARAIPGATIRKVADAGHTVFLEQPGIFNSYLLDFLGQN